MRLALIYGGEGYEREVSLLGFRHLFPILNDIFDLFPSLSDISYIPMIMCFVMFLANDLYGLYNWKKMQKRQRG